MLEKLAADSALGLYGLAGRAAAPLVRGHLQRRAARGREDPARLGERLGHAGQARPPGPLVWWHGASIGEALSALPLIERLAAGRPRLTQLVTTGTVTSARILARRLPAGVIHQYAPLDLPAAAARFLGHWRPDLAAFIESELWPNLLLGAAKGGTELLLVNARVSPHSQASWRRFPPLIGRLLGCFSLVLAQSPEDAARLRALGARAPLCLGNLKFAAPPLEADPARLAALREAIGDRPAWLAASTHPGEEDIAAEVHETLAEHHPGLVTLIAPRHPERAAAIAAGLARRGLTVARRSLDQEPGSDAGIYLADTIGELGLFYRLCEIAFVGGSLVAHGGQNPIEPARLDTAILCGPHHANFARVVAEMAGHGAVKLVADGTELTGAVASLLGDPDQRGTMARAARRYAESQAQVLDAVLEALAPALDRLAGGSAG